MTNVNSGFLAISSMLNLPEGGYISLGEALSQETYPEVVSSGLTPVRVESIEPQGQMLTTRMLTESGAGIQATSSHKILKAVPNKKDGYLLQMTALSDLNAGDLIIVNPRINGKELTFDLSPVASVEMYAVEEVYSITVDSSDRAFLCNGIINQGQGEIS